tara:strand:+ start:59 stop:595 length:537 start_codon:yes stop_codon:yes gene_type:complete
MKKLSINKTKIKDVFLINHNLFKDKRGSFKRGVCITELKKNNIKFDIKQANFSENLIKGTLRGFHMQRYPYQESKLLTCARGSIFNVIIDMRKNSKTFGKHASFVLNEKNKNSVLIPKGCANAFLTLENNSLIHYYCSQIYSSKHEMGFRYDDPFLKIKWPIKIKIISEKDLNHPLIR